MVGITADTDVTVTLRLPASAAHVRTARLIAAAMARRSGVGENLLDEVRLAVGEACGRAVRMHERQGVTDPVTVEFTEGARFGVAVINRAKMLPAEALPALGDPGVAPWADPSGEALGLALLGAVVQDLAVEQDMDGGTRVSMSWPRD